MVSILDSIGTREGEITREYLMRVGIPCALYGDESLIDKDDMVISFDDDVGHLKNERLVKVDKAEFESTRGRSAELLRFEENAKEMLWNKYGIDVMAFFAERYFIRSDRIYVCGTSMRLTPSEKCILVYLSCYPDCWTPADKLAQNCIVTGSNSSLRVHISMINEKIRMNTCSLPRFIMVKRGCGYRMYPFFSNVDQPNGDAKN